MGDLVNKKDGNKKRFKLYKSKFIIMSTILTASLVTGGAFCLKRQENSRVNANEEYYVGYDDINLLTNKLTNRVTNNNFVLLDIGDHNSNGINFQKQKLDYCVENGIDIGLIVSSDANSFSDIYFDLEYAMGIMEEYRVTYPLYLNVDQLFYNEKNTYDDALELSLAFLEKASANNIYVGVSGSQENLNGKFLAYDRLITDSNESGMIKEENGVYYATLDLKEQIVLNNLNHPNCLLNDEYYVCRDGDNLREIANYYGLTVLDLKRYNKMVFSFLAEGKVLRIPNRVQNINNHLFTNEIDYLNGIDTSFWQGVIDWSEVEADYAIIQVRDFINPTNDSQFEANVKGCMENNIPMGFYVFSRATSIAELREETSYLVEQLKGINATYPIYLDLETEFWKSITDDGKLSSLGYSPEQTTEFILNFIKVWERDILAAGYIPGIYCNGDLQRKLNLVTNNYLDNLSCWIAGGLYYDKNYDYTDKDNLPLVSADGVAMRQISQYGYGSGINGNIDINYCYVDYSDGIHEFERLHFPREINTLKTVTPYIIGTSMILYLKKKYNKRKVRRMKRNIS